MVSRNIIRVVGLIGLVLALAGCVGGKVKTVHYDGEGQVVKEETTSESVYVMETQGGRNDDKVEQLYNTLDVCDSRNPNTTGEEYSNCRLGNIATLLVIRDMTEDDNAEQWYWRDRLSRRESRDRLIGLGLSFAQPFAYALAFGPGAATGYGGGSYVKNETHYDGGDFHARADEDVEGGGAAQPETQCVGCIGVGQGIDRGFVAYDAKVGQAAWPGSFANRGRNAQVPGGDINDGQDDRDSPDIGINPL